MRLRKPILLLFCLLAALRTASAAEVDPEKYLENVKYLASPELKGRGTGSPELDKAADYIARQFRAIGLKPAGEKNYYQAFQVTKNAKLVAGNRLSFVNGKEKTSLKFNTDFRPLNFSASGRLSGPVVFVGYGITAPEYNYDDYAGVDVKDKVVLMLRHEPQEFDEKSVFAGRIFTNHAQFLSKAFNAKSHGARAVILVQDKSNHRNNEDSLEDFSGSVGPASQGIPIVQVKAELADRWLAPAGRGLDEIGEAIDKNLKPQSFPLPSSFQVDLSVSVEREVRGVHNVAGYLEGETSEYLIIGAHYDHLGLGEQYSMAPSKTGTAHPGADDNASGTAGVIELARLFASGPKPRRGILFLAFAGEELGLLGASHYVNHPALPLENAVAMINLDMIGRVRESKVYIGGVGTGSNFKVIVEEANGNPKFNLDLSDTDGYGSSDHYCFVPRSIPVLFFFSGLHSDYHKPSDTWDKISAPETARFLDYIARISERLLNEPARPQFVSVAGRE